MKLRTFRAATMYEALAMVRRELGPDAALLHTREVRSRWLRWLPGPRLIEVTASCDVNVPSRLPARPPVRAAKEVKISQQVEGQFSTLQAMMKDLCRRSKAGEDWPEPLLRLFAELIEAKQSEAAKAGSTGCEVRSSECEKAVKD